MSAAPRPRPSAATLVRAGRPVPSSRSGRYLLSQDQWAAFAERLDSDPLHLSGLWSDGAEIHALLLESADAPLIASVAVERQRFLALSPMRASAILPERIVRDLWGIEAMAARDLRPWLDHGAWGLTAPLAARPGPASWPPEPPDFLWDEADDAAGAFQLPIGPVQTLTIGPAQFRLTLVGERIRRLEPLLGAAHRGIALALRGLQPDQAIRLVARIDATASVAHQLAFARAVEAASGVQPGRATEALRRAMGALERMAIDLHHLARLWSLRGHRAAAARAGSLRGMLLPAAEAAFGDRLMMRSLAPGGWSVPPDKAGLAAMAATLDKVEAGLDPLPDDLPGQDRLLSIERDLVLCRSGCDPLRTVPEFGQEEERPGARAEEHSGQPVADQEGLGMAEAAQGQVWHWVRLENGVVSAWHAVDPNLACVAALASEAVGLDRDGLALLCARFGVSVSGADQ